MSRKIKKSSGVDGFQRKLDSIRVEAVLLCHDVVVNHCSVADRKSNFATLLKRADKLPVHDKYQDGEKTDLINELIRFQKSPNECRDGLRFTTYQIESPDLFIPLADKIGVPVRDSYREQVGVMAKN